MRDGGSKLRRVEEAHEEGASREPESAQPPGQRRDSAGRRFKLRREHGSRRGCEERAQGREGGHGGEHTGRFEHDPGAKRGGERRKSGAETGEPGRRSDGKVRIEQHCPVLGGLQAGVARESPRRFHQDGATIQSDQLAQQQQGERQRVVAHELQFLDHAQHILRPGFSQILGAGLRRPMATQPPLPREQRVSKSEQGHHVQSGAPRFAQPPAQEGTDREKRHVRVLRQGIQELLESDGAQAVPHRREALQVRAVFVRLRAELEADQAHEDPRSPRQGHVQVSFLRDAFLGPEHVGEAHEEMRGGCATVSQTGNAVSRQPGRGLLAEHQGPLILERKPTADPAIVAAQATLPGVLNRGSFSWGRRSSQDASHVSITILRRNLLW